MTGIDELSIQTQDVVSSGGYDGGHYTLSDGRRIHIFTNNYALSDNSIEDLQEAAANLKNTASLVTKLVTGEPVPQG